ncbi:hypothetical protein K469DRAFT_700046 [Zopfia rhizophila CBS 207.26]|uniref:Uncharacterized protein n=1 Tax=Zopfia rhizophila CBS 207.26 TaxID=1314779 RepID=A0A6A6DE98_9PEZI|nr:hypothetical protein K469DRAFT_700046 [Zopfia rhizophila CBS 207.26]
MNSRLTYLLGADLPHRLKSVKIAALMDGHRQAATLEQLNGIICRVLPIFSPEERGRFRSLNEGREWPWFTLEDGTVQFEQPSSRWFLAGREIESYECR